MSTAVPLTEAELPKNPNPEPNGADHKRHKAIERAWRAYRGEFPPAFKQPNGLGNDNVAPNRCGPIIDKGVSWLFGKEVILEARPADEDGLTQGEQGDEGSVPAADNDEMGATLKRIWGNSDDMLTMLTMLAMNGGVSGHAFLKIVWDSEKMEVPRLAVLDSSHLFVTSDPDDCNRAVVYTIEYKAYLGTQANGQPTVIAKRQVIALVDPDGNSRMLGGEDDDDTWTIANYIRYEQNGNQQSGWKQVGEVVTWPYPFPPIVDCMNLPNPNEYWGLPDLEPALIDLNERIQFVESNIAKIIKSHAHPWVFATGCDPSAIVNEPGVVQGLASPDAKVFAVNAAGDLAASMRFCEDLRADMDEQSRVPAVALGRQESLPKGNLSGVALELLFQPLIEKTELKRRLYGQLIRRASAYCLVILKKIRDCEDVEIHIKWPNLLPVDDLAAANTAQVLTQIGVSTQTVMEQLGYDPDEEAERSNEDAQRKATQQVRGQAPMQLPGALAAKQQKRMSQARTMALQGQQPQGQAQLPPGGATASSAPPMMAQ